MCKSWTISFTTYARILAHKGWNDPPTFSYDSFQQNIGKKSQLTKRPDYTVDQLSKTSAQEVQIVFVSVMHPVKNYPNKTFTHAWHIWNTMTEEFIASLCLTLAVTCLCSSKFLAAVCPQNSRKLCSSFNSIAPSHNSRLNLTNLTPPSASCEKLELQFHWLEWFCCHVVLICKHACVVLFSSTDKWQT